MCSNLHFLAKVPSQSWASCATPLHLVHHILKTWSLTPWLPHDFVETFDFNEVIEVAAHN